MGKSIYICRVPDSASLALALRSVGEHNAAPNNRVGPNFTLDFFRTLDPMRAAFVEAQAPEGVPTASLQIGCMEHWTRGDDIAPEGAIISYGNLLWLEVQNFGGGACSTLWMQKHFPQVGWIGTTGKPRGFHESPMVSPWVGFQELVGYHEKLVSES